GMSVAGAVLGAIGLLITIALIALGAAFFNSPTVRNFQQCVEQAGNDRVQLDRCAAEFGRQIGGG
ncbi:MAG: hypothetical protein ACRDTF_15925, partial [Pseudonocardiaceae bacterium]